MVCPPRECLIQISPVLGSVIIVECTNADDQS